MCSDHLDLTALTTSFPTRRAADVPCRRHRPEPKAKSSLHKAHLSPDAGLKAPVAGLSVAQSSHDFESLDRGIGRGVRLETAHRLDQYLGLSVIGLDHV